MKYYIAESIEDGIEIKKEIIPQEYHEYRDCIKNIKYYSLTKHFKNIAMKNGTEFTEYLINLKKLSVKLPNDGFEIGIEANRLALNYLVSFRTFVDNIQTYARKIKNGEMFETNILNKIYDKENVYAFFYKLRNFVAHFGMLFDSMIIEHGKFELQCSKEHLLEYDKWKDENIIFLNSCPEYLPILDYVEKMNMLLLSIYFGFVRYFAEELQDLYDNVMKLIRHYKIMNPIFIECESIEKIEDANIIGLRLEILREVTEELSKLPNVKINYVKIN